MAMSNCKECGKAVSTLAKTCPSCGVPKPAKVLKKKTSTKKITTKIKKDKPQISSKKKTSKQEYVYNPNTGSFDKGPDKNKSSSSYDSKKGYNPKTGSFERESNKNKITKTNNEINQEEQRRRQEESKQNNQYWKDIAVAANDQELIRKQKALLALENQKQRDEEQERREQRQRTARQEAINYQEDAAKRKPSVDYINKQNEVKTTSGKKDIFDQFNEGTLDLATAFWGFGVLGSTIVGVICGVLSETVSKLFNIPYVILSYLIITMLWACAENHKKNMTQQKQSGVWGILTQVFCIFGGLGLIGFIFANK
jgi:ribosomal protein L37E